jgi:glycosyltransferase involved in cell wall biosynthesis
MNTSNSKIAWLYPKVMGTNTLFTNIEESAPASVLSRSVWIGLHFEPTTKLLRSLPLPDSLKMSLDFLKQVTLALREHPEVTTIVIANLPQSPAYLPLVLCYAAYFSIDITPSLIREQSPWYDAILPPTGAIGIVHKALLRWTYRLAAGIFPWSAWAGEGVHRDFGVPRERIFVGLPGAHVKNWPFMDRTMRDQAQPVRILLVGREFRRKGGDILLEWAESTTSDYAIDFVTAFEQLPEWVRALAPGMPEPHHALSYDLSPRLPRVRVHCGLRANAPELLALYQAADIFCLPTLADTSSIASLEAMATGLPVVVSAVGGIPELIVHGETGLLVRPGDSRDLGSKLELLIEDRELRSRIGLAARKACEGYFNVDRLLAQMVEAIDRHPRRPVLARRVRSGSTET